MWPCMMYHVAQAPCNMHHVPNHAYVMKPFSSTYSHHLCHYSLINFLSVIGLSHMIYFRGSAEVLGPEAAAMLSTKGFPSKVRQAAGDSTGPDSEEAAAAAERKREDEARDSLINLGIAWALASVSLAHHFGHLLHVL